MSRTFIILLLNILFIVAIWYMDVNHNLDRLGEKKTRGIFKFSPETGFRISQYFLIIILIFLDLMLVI